MILIAHRGNIEGSNKSLENYPGYVDTALEKGYHAEIDVWRVDGKLLLGHDSPQYPVDVKFLKNEKLLCHAKNRDAFEYMLQFDDIHSFWHQEDEYTLSSRRIPIIYPNKPLVAGGIAMIRDYYTETDYSLCYGICSDYVGIGGLYKK